MIRNIAAAAECNYKIHKGARGAYEKEGDIFQGGDVPQMGLCHKTAAILNAVISRRFTAHYPQDSCFISKQQMV